MLHAGGKVGLAQVQLGFFPSAQVGDFEGVGDATAADGETYPPAFDVPASPYLDVQAVPVAVVDPERVAGGLGLGQGVAVGLSVVDNFGPAGFVAGGEGEASHTAVQGFQCCNGAPFGVVHGAAYRHAASFVVDGLEGHSAGQPSDHLPAFGVETQVQRFVVGRGRAVIGHTLGARVAGDFHGILPRLFGPVENREHPRIVAAFPVEHHSRVGAHFVETSYQQRRGEGELAVAPASFYLQLLRLDDAPLGGEQLDIEHLTHLGGSQLRRGDHIGGKPHGLAQVVARIVEVQVDLLLRIVLSEMIVRLHPIGHRQYAAVDLG